MEITLTILKTIFKKFFNFKQHQPLTVGLPENHRLYCIGDIHGCLDLLEDVHRKIAIDASRFDGTKILVYLGDYVDRGMYSKQVVDCLLENHFPEFEQIFLLGNHEQVLLQFLNSKDPSIAHDWFMFGGLATLTSYGVVVKGIPTNKDLVHLAVEFREKMPAAHATFYQDLRLSYEIGGYFFAHAGVKPKLKLSRQRSEHLLWIRDEFLSSNLFHGKVIVHGHSVTQSPDIRRNRIGLDTGAYASGVLSCAVFEGSSCRLL